jgi:hypothetical protein
MTLTNQLARIRPSAPSPPNCVCKQADVDRPIDRVHTAHELAVREDFLLGPQREGEHRAVTRTESQCKRKLDIELAEVRLPGPDWGAGPCQRTAFLPMASMLAGVPVPSH